MPPAGGSEQAPGGAEVRGCGAGSGAGQVPGSPRASRPACPRGPKTTRLPPLPSHSVPTCLLHVLGAQVCGPTFQRGPQFRTQVSREETGARPGGGVGRVGEGHFLQPSFPSLKAAAEETLESLRPCGGPPK